MFSHHNSVTRLTGLDKPHQDLTVLMGLIMPFIYKLKGTQFMPSKRKPPSAPVKKYACSYGIIKPENKLCVKVVDLATGSVVEETFTIEDQAVLSLTCDLIGFPLEELSFGLYGDDRTVKSIVDDTVEQAKEQLAGRKDTAH